VSAAWGPPQLIALDIDGTVMSDFSTVSERVVAAIKRALAAGAHVVLATGRPVISTLPVLAELGITTGNVLCSNGAVRMDIATGKLVNVHHFDPAPLVTELSTRLPGALFAVERPGLANLVTGAFPLSETTQDLIVDLATLIADPVARLTVYWEGHTGPELSAAALGDHLNAVSYHIAPEDPWLVAMSATVSKGTAIEAIRHDLGIPLSATLAVGDADNDLEMLRWAGLGVAMGQASDEVKAAAREVTGSVDEDGLAVLLERWF
jgi:hydroxymethylpyrimidine pyrophosphatase-like HAD family hydrolase